MLSYLGKQKEKLFQVYTVWHLFENCWEMRNEGRASEPLRSAFYFQVDSVLTRKSINLNTTQFNSPKSLQICIHRKQFLSISIP